MLIIAQLVTNFFVIKGSQIFIIKGEIAYRSTVTTSQMNPKIHLSSRKYVILQQLHWHSFIPCLAPKPNNHPLYVACTAYSVRQQRPP
jgi:hypothetical protein